MRNHERDVHGRNIQTKYGTSAAMVSAEILFRAALHEIANGAPKDPAAFARYILGGARDPKADGYWPDSVYEVGVTIKKALE